MVGGDERRAWAPGRVNLIGEHTDYTGGLALPMAIQLGTTVTGRSVEGRLRLTSDHDPTPLDIALAGNDPAEVSPAWGRYPAAVAAELGGATGFDGAVSSDLPIGAGLSSSASLEVATALALGAPGSPLELATICQRAEHRASGVPCGIIDQLAATAGVAGHALLIDCTTLVATPIPIPASARFVVVHSGQHRTLVGSEYAERRRATETAARLIGPLSVATLDAVDAVDDPTIVRRARHVITENQRVRDFVAALAANDLPAAGQLMVASHRSLRDDFDVSTEVLDGLVDDLLATAGVYGARLTGAGFGGCVIALCDPRAEITFDRGWVVSPADGARLL